MDLDGTTGVNGISRESSEAIEEFLQQNQERHAIIASGRGTKSIEEKIREAGLGRHLNAQLSTATFNSAIITYQGNVISSSRLPVRVTAPIIKQCTENGINGIFYAKDDSYVIMNDEWMQWFEKTINYKFQDTPPKNMQHFVNKNALTTHKTLVW